MTTENKNENVTMTQAEIDIAIELAFAKKDYAEVKRLSGLAVKSEKKQNGKAARNVRRYARSLFPSLIDGDEIEITVTVKTIGGNVMTATKTATYKTPANNPGKKTK